MSVSFAVLFGSLSFDVPKEGTDAWKKTYLRWQGQQVVECLVCEESITAFCEFDLQQHYDAWKHKERMQALRVCLFAFKEKCGRLCQLDCKPFRDKLGRFEEVRSRKRKAIVHTNLYRFVVGDEALDTDTIKKFERLEQLALLELAVWKSKCLQQMPSEQISLKLGNGLSLAGNRAKQSNGNPMT
jgi:hypothetical protein